MPEYDRALEGFYREIIEGFRAHDPLLSQIAAGPEELSAHGGTVRMTHEGQPIDAEPQRTVFSVTLSEAAVRHADVDEIAGELHKAATEFLGEAAKQFFAAAERITSFTGRTYDAAGRAMTWELVIEMIERTPPDERNEHLIVVHPDNLAQLGEPTTEQKQRLDDILAAKRSAYESGRRRRRIPR